MVRINCILQGKPPRPYVAAWLSIRNYRARPILFLIDTGLTMSFLSPIDAVSMGIRLEELPPPPYSMTLISLGRIIPITSVGVIGEYNIKFITKAGWYELLDENIYVLKEEHGYKLPSILGNNFLINHGLKLILDHSKNFVEIENNQ